MTDRTTLKINKITVFENIQDVKYQVNGRTSLEWAIDRYEINAYKEQYS